MPDFHFSCPIEVRYGDLDPQGHVNNAKFLSYLEQARINYLLNLGLISKESLGKTVGFILADVHVTFLAPVLFSSAVQVQVGVTRLGNKSLTMEYLLLDQQTGQSLATGSTVVVTYDYQKHLTMPIPETWRQKIIAFEGLVS